MNKTSLMILAAAVLLVTGTANAGEVHYRIYGKAHVSTELLDNGDASGLFISSNSTRIGINGKYATDVEWLDVVFQYESQADLSNAKDTNLLSSRNSFVGVHGDGWGRLVWGRHDTPMKTLGRKTDLFSDRIGDSRSALGGYTFAFESRQDNMVLYTSPMFGDRASLNLQFVPAEGVDGAALFSGSAYYTVETYFVGLAFESHGRGLTPGPESTSAFRIGAGYLGESYKILGVFHTVSNSQGVDGASAVSFGFGGSWRPSRWEPKAQIYVVDPDTDGDNTSATMLVFGTDYHLSRKAVAYATVAVMSNDEAAAFAPFYGGHGQQFPYTDGVVTSPAKPGETAYGIAIGLIARW